jgi:hypothetical protein
LCWRLARVRTKRKRNRWFQTLGFQSASKQDPLAVDSVPSFLSLDHSLELSEPLERHADGELGVFPIQGGDDLVAEEGAVHADLDDDPGESLSDRLDTGQDELTSPVGIVDVAGAVEEVEHLAGLGDGAEQGIVAAGPLAFLVVADRGALGPPAGGLDRAVEVQGDAGQAQSG